MLSVHDPRDEEMALLGMELDLPAPTSPSWRRAMGCPCDGPIDDPNLLSAAMQRGIRHLKEHGTPVLIDAFTPDES